ncbi:MAG: uncharacterized protein PWQ16_395 [bacterium]|nr:uncharacterized protein [bacterium]
MLRKWYETGLRFECLACGRCCRGEPGYVWCSMEELERISSFVGMPLQLFISMYAIQIGKEWSLKEEHNGDCVFYDRKSAKCLIYEVRPSQCKTFPFWPSILASKEKWDSLAKSCPGINRGRLYTFEEVNKIAFTQPMKHKL